MATKKKEDIFEELMHFLGGPMFQVPVNSFMDEKSLIFDPGQKTINEHKLVYKEYKEIVDSLLNAFCEDSKMKQDEVVKNIEKFKKSPSQNDLFNTYFEQVLAANNYNLFHNIMSHRNLVIQEQVLSMILASTGKIPSSMMHDPVIITCSPVEDTPTKNETFKKKIKNTSITNSKSYNQLRVEPIKNGEAKPRDSSNSNKNNSEAKMDYLKVEAVNEEALEKEVMQKMLKTTLKDKKTLNFSAYDKEFSQLQQERKNMEEKMRKLVRSTEHEEADTPVEEAKESTSLIASGEDVKKRQEFFRQQRDELIKMKAQMRTQMLQNFEEDDNDKRKNDRPVSSRTARILMAGGEASKRNNDKQNDKQMALRRAITNKLKKEVIRK